MVKLGSGAMIKSVTEQETMDARKRKRLESAGWKVGDIDEFLGLARKIGSSQSRVAKMEAADSTVSLDSLVRTLLTLGMPMSQIARVLGSGLHAKVA